jgi:hypothetical protein
VDDAQQRSFFAYGFGAVLVVVACLLAVLLVRTDGTLVYVVDDPAIHLSMATTLAEHGTWGVQAGEFQSASSSPLWTLLAAALVKVLPGGHHWLPLLLNLVAAAIIVALFARSQSFLHPERRWLDRVVLVGLVLVVLFLPGLVFVGMEHVAHMALVVAIVWLFAGREEDRPIGPAWLPYVLLATSALVRFETLFVAAAIGAAVLARQLLQGWREGPARVRVAVRTVVLVGLAAGLPVVAFGAFNKAMGQGWLPNSVLAKSTATDGVDAGVSGWDTLEALARDPFVLVTALLAVAYLVWAWDGRRPAGTVFTAIVVAVTAALHSALASYGWYDRYQGYLIALALWFVLRAAGELVPADQRSRAVLVLGLAALVLCPVKAQLLLDVPLAADNTYRQRYQAGEFLAQYYDGTAIATGELGYITLAHDGPIVDLLGLGNYEALQARRNGTDSPEFWAELTDRYGVEAAAVYPSTLFFRTPADWVLAGEWTLGQRNVTAFEENFQFWATSPDGVAGLREKLLDYESQLPEGVELRLNELADLTADRIREAQAAEAADATTDG